MKYLVYNLKANKTKDEMLTYERKLSNLKSDENIELIVCPSTMFLYQFENSNYKLGAQDISQYDVGAHTGENTAEQLASLNVKYALIGHSERRQLFKEEEKVIIEKIKKAYHNHIKPIYFIGETLEEKNNDNTEQVLYNQLTIIIDQVPDYKREKMIIVYEPIWSIGTGVTPTNAEIEDRIIRIKEILKNKYNLNLAVLYGGSVNSNNIDTLCQIKKIDGFVIGESSKEITLVFDIYQKFQKYL